MYLKGYTWLLSQNQQELTFFVTDGVRHWLSIPDLFLKKINVQGRQHPDELVCNVTNQCDPTKDIMRILQNFLVAASEKILQYSETFLKKRIPRKMYVLFSFKWVLWDSFNGVEASHCFPFKQLASVGVWLRHSKTLKLTGVMRYPWWDIWWPHQIGNQLYNYTHTYWHTTNRFLMLSTKIRKWCHLETSSGLLWWKFQSHNLLELEKRRGCFFFISNF